MHWLRRKYGLAILTSFYVIPSIGLKYVFCHWNLEIFETSTMVGAMVGGTIFLTSFILSGTLSDFKEGERFPSEIASSLENVYIEGVAGIA